MPKILLPIGDAAEVLDTLYAYYRIREQYQAVVAGPQRRVYPLVMHEIPPGWDITRESPGYHLPAQVAFSEVLPADYRSEEHTSELQSPCNLGCRLLLVESAT